MASIRVYQRRSGATSYYVTWRDKDTGKQTSMPFDNERVAGRFKRLIETNKGSLAPTLAMLDAISAKSPLMSVVIQKHIDGLSGISSRTRADYKRDAALHIIPQLGHIPVAALTVADVAAWLNDLADQGKADKTIANIHSLLSAAIASHRPDNPARGIRLPRERAHEKAEMVCLSKEEWYAIDAAIPQFDNGHYQLALRTLIGTGMRWGEMAALQVGDLMLDGQPPMVHIRRAVKRDSQSRYYVGPTKTRAGERTISITAKLTEQLREHTAGMKRKDRVFSSPEGSLLNPSHARARVWLRAVEASGINVSPRIHDLRHTHASWLIAEHVDLMTVQRRLGHESIITTTKVYGHLMPGQQTAAADAIASILDD